MSRVIKIRAWDAIQAKKDGKHLTLIDVVIMARSRLTHLEIQFDSNRNNVSFSSTLADGANGCRFKYIQYSHPLRWVTVILTLSDEDEKRLWKEACRMADVPAGWQNPYLVKSGFFHCSPTTGLEDVLYYGSNHVGYDKVGLLSFALEKSKKWWLTCLRYAVWCWTACVKPHPNRVWCSESICTIWNRAVLYGILITPAEIDPEEAVEKFRIISENLLTSVVIVKESHDEPN